MSRAFHTPEDDLPLSGRTVLQIIPHLDTGGAERTTVDIAHALVEAGARALVATESGRLIPELQAKGGIWVPFPAATKNPFGILANIKRLEKIIRQERVDLLHARSRAPAWTSLLAARLTFWKGQKYLIEATALLRERGITDIVTILAGDAQGRSHYVSELETLIADRSLADHVHLVGHCSDMPAAFLAASAVAVPSTEPEAFGRSAVEAQAMGTPVVVTELGAVPETVIDTPASERTGWRVPPSDAQALADALSETLTLGASARESLADRARHHVETQFSLETMTQATLGVYRRLLARENSG